MTQRLQCRARVRRRVGCIIDRLGLNQMCMGISSYGVLSGIPTTPTFISGSSFLAHEVQEFDNVGFEP